MSIRRVHRLAIIGYLLTIVDIAATVVGILLGIIEEGNPLMRWIMNTNPIMYGVVIFLVLTCAFTVIYTYGYKFRFIIQSLFLIIAVKLMIIGAHAYWVFSYMLG